MTPYRELVHACSRGGTYKYFLRREDVLSTWARLSAEVGPLRKNEAMKTMEIEGAAFLLRATLLGNPITVVRKRKCTADDVRRLHVLLGFVEDESVV